MVFNLRNGDLNGLANDENHASSRGWLLLAVVLVLFGLAMRSLLFTEPLFVAKSATACINGIGPSAWVSCFQNGYWPANKLFSMIEWKLLGNPALTFKLINMLLWAADAFLLMVALLMLSGSSTVSVVAAIFWVVHSLNVPLIATMSGRGFLLGFMFLLWAVLFLDRFKRRKGGMEIPTPVPSKTGLFLLIALAALSSPITALAPILFLMLTRRTLKEITIDTGEYDNSEMFLAPVFLYVIVAATLVFVIAAGFVATSGIEFEGLDVSFANLLGAGFGFLGNSLLWLAYPRWVVWNTYLLSFGASSFAAICGAVALFATGLAYGFVEFRKKDSIPGLREGLAMLLVGEIAIVLSLFLYKRPPDTAFADALLPGAAVLGASVFAYLWERATYTAPLRMALVLVVVVLVGIAFIRTEKLSWRWSEWDNFGSWYSDMFKSDPQLNMAWAEYFLANRNAEAALHKIPEDTHGLLYLTYLKAVSLKQLGRNEEALSYFGKYIDATTKNRKRTVLEMAEVLIGLNEYDEAKKLVDDFGVQSGRALYVRGLIAENAKDFEQAIGYYKRYLAIAPDDVDTLLALGRTLLELKRFQQAKGYLELAFTYDKSLPVVRMLKDCYLGLGNCTQAESLLRRVLLTPELEKQEKVEVATMLKNTQIKCYGAPSDETNGLLDNMKLLNDTKQQKEPLPGEEDEPVDSDDPSGKNPTELPEVPEVVE